MDTGESWSPPVRNRMFRSVLFLWKCLPLQAASLLPTLHTPSVSICLRVSHSLPLCGCNTLSCLGTLLPGHFSPSKPHSCVHGNQVGDSMSGVFSPPTPQPPSSPPSHGRGDLPALPCLGSSPQGNHGHIRVLVESLYPSIVVWVRWRLVALNGGGAAIGGQRDGRR